MPDQSKTTMPGGVPYIVGNEAAERFSFYGMKSILVIFATTMLLNSAGEQDFFNEAGARGLMAYSTAAANVVPFDPEKGADTARQYATKYVANRRAERSWRQKPATGGTRRSAISRPGRPGRR